MQTQWLQGMRRRFIPFAFAAGSVLLAVSGEADAPSADLEVSLDGPPAEVAVGTTGDFVAVVVNQGPDPASSVTLALALTSADVVSVIPSEDSVCAGTSCTVPMLLPFGEFSITVSVVFDRQGEVAADATSTTAVADPDPGDESDSHPVHVNGPPAPVADLYALAEDDQLDEDAEGGLSANDADPDGDFLRVLVLATAAHGALTVGTDGAIAYTPDPDFHGSDAFTYQASDDFFDSEPVSVALSITPVNDAPVAEAESYAAVEDIALEIAAPQGVLANDSDPDGDAIEADIDLAGQPEHGSLALDDETGAFTYTPDPDFSGSDSFRYVATDGTADSIEIDVEIEVAGVDDVPARPVLMLPGDAAVVSLPLNLQWEPSTDADGEDVTYTVTITRLPDGDPLTFDTEDSVLLLPAGGAIGDGSWSWRVQAFDPDGSTQGPSTPRTFLIGSPGAGGGCACSLQDTGSRTPGLALPLLAALVLTRRRIARD